MWRDRAQAKRAMWSPSTTIDGEPPRRKPTCREARPIYGQRHLGSCPPYSDRAVTTTFVVTHEFEVPTPLPAPECVEAGPDGNLWFTQLLPNQIRRILAETPHSMTEFESRDEMSGPASIVTAPDDGIWFTEYEGSKARPPRPLSSPGHVGLLSRRVHVAG